MLMRDGRIARTKKTGSPEEIACMKSRNDGSAASTVSGSTGSGGSTRNFATRVVQSTFVAARIELKEWACWRNIRSRAILSTSDGLTRDCACRCQHLRGATGTHTDCVDHDGHHKGTEPKKFKSFTPHVDVKAIQTFLSDA